MKVVKQTKGIVHDNRKDRDPSCVSTVYSLGLCTLYEDQLSALLSL